MGTFGDERRSGGRKWLFGCAGGCLGFIVISAAALGILFYLAVRAVPLVPPETFLGQSAEAFIIAKIEPSDEALVALLQELAKQPPGSLDMAQEQLNELRRQADQMGERLSAIAPIQVVVTGRYGEEEGEEFTGGIAFSVNRFSGLVRWLMNLLVKRVPETGGSVTEYKGLKIGTSAQGASLAAKGNNFMFAGDVGVIKEWIDRIEEQRQIEEAGGEGGQGLISPACGQVLQSVYDRLPSDAPVRFGSINTGGQLRRLLSDDEKKQFATTVEDLGLLEEGVSAVGGTVRVLSAREAEIKVLAFCESPQGALALAERLRSRGPAIEERLQIQNWQVSSDDRVVEFAFLVPDVAERITRSNPAKGR